MDLATDFQDGSEKGTFNVNSAKGKPSLVQVPRLKVSSDHVGVVSHAGVGLLREVADLSGLSLRVSAVSADTFKGLWLHDTGRVSTDLTALVGGGGFQTQ